jgi:long-chain acyl-CoA synthetase
MMKKVNRVAGPIFSIVHAIDSWAEKIPESKALVMPSTGKAYTYKELNESINRVANSLKGAGVKEGDRVAISMTNCAEFPQIFYGIMKCRAIAVPLNPLLKPGESQYIIENCEPKYIFVNKNTQPVYQEVKSKVKGLQEIILIGDEPAAGTISYIEFVKNSSGDCVAPWCASDDVCEIMYTSGTTGRPKGVMQTHIGLYQNKMNFVLDWNLTPDDKMYSVAPLYFAAAQGAAMDGAFVAGATLYLGEGWKGAEDAMQVIEKYKITYFFGPPVFWVFILNHPKVNDYDMTSMRIGFSGGAALAVETFHQFKKRFGFDIVEGAGMTETSPLFTLNPFNGLKKPGSCGTILPNTRMKIVDADDNEVPAGVDGEICFKGIHVMPGYWRMPEETAHTLRGGWMHTGDIGHIDQDGYLYITDRIKDIIIRGGSNVASREVEEILFKHGKILDVAVIGVPDKVMGEEIKAFVILKPGEEASEELAKDIKKFVGEKIATFKVPRYIEFTTELPRTPSGKVMKVELRKRPFVAAEWKKS